MTIQLPSANQPVDYDFISNIVREINKVQEAVSSLKQGSTSQIKGNAINQSDVIVFGTEVQIQPPGTESYSEATISFNDVSFKNPPIVTATAQTGFTKITFTITATNITNKGCKLSVVWGPVKPTTTMTIAVLAVGQRASLLG